jgi:hypothetical protein
MKYRKLICFDFDDTLFHTPPPEKGKPIWKEKTGTDWPYRGWWGKTESIGFTKEGEQITYIEKDGSEMPIFEIPKNEWVYEKYLKAVAEKDTNSETYIILATGRVDSVPGMRQGIEKILRENNMVFDEVHLNWGEDTFRFKQKLFEQMIEKLGVEEFTMYDDRQEHLPKFEDWATTQSAKINVVDVVNKTEKTFN